jgi:hypothetical protein
MPRENGPAPRFASSACGSRLLHMASAAELTMMIAEDCQTRDRALRATNDGVFSGRVVFAASNGGIGVPRSFPERKDGLWEFNSVGQPELLRRRSAMKLNLPVQSPCKS